MNASSTTTKKVPMAASDAGSSGDTMVIAISVTAAFIGLLVLGFVIFLLIKSRNESSYDNMVSESERLRRFRLSLALSDYDGKSTLSTSKICDKPDCKDVDTA